MEFDKTKVYTALNADESLIGAKGYFADNIADLIEWVPRSNVYEQRTVKEIKNYYIVSDLKGEWQFFYLVEPAPNKCRLVKDDMREFDNYDNFIKEFSEEGTVHILKKNIQVECEQFISEHSKPKYRPFKDCDELIKTYHRKLMEKYKTSVDFTDIELPSIWVKDSSSKARFMITCFGYGGVSLNGSSFINLDILYNQYTFLGGSPCGVKE